MDQGDRVKLEESYFTDAEKFDELLAAENDLVDAYVRNELPRSERELLEKQYGAIPEKRLKVEFARALTHVSYERSATAPAINKASLWESMRIFFSGSNQSLRLAFLTGAAVVIVGVSWLAIQNRNLRSGLSKAQAKELELQQSEEKLRQQFADMQRGQVTSNQKKGAEVAQLDNREWPEVPLRLVPGAVRSAGTSTILHLPLSSSWVRLEMEVAEEEYSYYEVVLQTPQGQDIYRKNVRAAKGRSGTVVMRLPSNLLHGGEYVVQLYGITGNASPIEIETYIFRIVQP
jgi:hypothetical protein